MDCAFEVIRLLVTLTGDGHAEARHGWNAILLPHANLLSYLLVFYQPLEELVFVEMVRI